MVKKGFYKTWIFNFSSPQYRGGIVYQTMYGSNKNVIKALRQELVEWIIKNSNMREYPIARDTLLIIDAESGVRRRFPKPLLGCSTLQLHNELIASPDDGDLL